MKKGNGEGTIFKREIHGKTKYVSQVSLGYHPDGKRNRPTVYGDTKREVQEKIDELRYKAKRGLITRSTRENLGSYLDRWLEDRSLDLKPKTIETYEVMIRTHLKPALGKKALQALRPAHIKAYLRKAASRGASPRVRQMSYNILHKALVDALRECLIAINPCDGVDKPKVQKKEMDILTPAEVIEFLEAAKEDRLYALYVVALSTGLRQGELLALEWRDFDRINGSISIQRNLVESKGRLCADAPKTKKSARRVTLPATAVRALESHRKRQALEDANLGPQSRAETKHLIFRDNKGGYLRKSNLIRRSFRKILQRANLRYIRFHDLRHTAASLMLQENIHPSVVQARLGHSSVMTTLDCYSHLLPSVEEAAATRLDHLFEELDNGGLAKSES